MHGIVLSYEVNMGCLLSASVRDLLEGPTCLTMNVSIQYLPHPVKKASPQWQPICPYTSIMDEEDVEAEITHQQLGRPSYQPPVPWWPHHAKFGVYGSFST